MSGAIANDGLNSYLNGNFVPFQKETTTFDLPITGELPKELCDRYLRAGPFLIDPESTKHHRLTGDGIVLGISLENTKADWITTDMQVQ
ncbi:MAG TPA: hypothetical protein EYG51_18095 [Pseudomonadales bacterium]|nr:hypothetical protein [Pseudomonadales bacterium]